MPKGLTDAELHRMLTVKVYIGGVNAFTSCWLDQGYGRDRDLPIGFIYAGDGGVVFITDKPFFATGQQYVVDHQTIHAPWGSFDDVSWTPRRVGRSSLILGGFGKFFGPRVALGAVERRVRRGEGANL